VGMPPRTLCVRYGYRSSGLSLSTQRVAGWGYHTERGSPSAQKLAGKPRSYTGEPKSIVPARNLGTAW